MIIIIQLFTYIYLANLKVLTATKSYLYPYSYITNYMWIKLSGVPRSKHGWSPGIFYAGLQHTQ